MSLPAISTPPESFEKEAVFLFSEGFAAWSDDPTARREHLGGKGAGLAEMVAAGIPVPPGLTVTADACREYYECGEKLNPRVFEAVRSKLSLIERQTGRAFGDSQHPLLLSVRSGSKFSMPGMMDTVLNLGLNETTVAALATETKNPRFAWDSYRRFVYMYGHVVLGVEKKLLDEAVNRCRERYSASGDRDLSPFALQHVVAELNETLERLTGTRVPEAPLEQLRHAITAVFRSWNTPRAVYYRTVHSIDHRLGTAVTIQAMVFGNRNDQSATGVCFTRNPSTGAPRLYGEFLTNAQGEEVVAGTRTPRPVEELENSLPNAARELERTAALLEHHYRDVQDIEFTIEDGKLFILQTRTGKRSAAAAIKVAVDMVSEGLIDRATALRRVTPAQLQQLLVPQLAPAARSAAIAAGHLLATGLTASPGAAQGVIALSPADAVAVAASGRAVILVREETCPDDIQGIVAAAGVVTARGGMTSHAAVVARGMGKPCIAGCEMLRIDRTTATISLGGRILSAGEQLSIDGSTGEIFWGPIDTIIPDPPPESRTLLSWADAHRRLQIRANADTPIDAARARRNGAEGIGLCRTEHMFMGEERLPLMRAMILADNRAERERALQTLLPLQREDFIAMFREMEGLPMTIRLLDPPLHEFLPDASALREEIAGLRANGAAESQLTLLEHTLRRVLELNETNPMMGFRGCRLGLVHPEIYAMQVRAIMEAALTVRRTGVLVRPEILIPLVSTRQELTVLRQAIEQVAAKTVHDSELDIPYSIGTMIEVPRACLVAETLSPHVDFFSFGTNDLTQMTFGFSRDDAEGTFLRHYLEGVQSNGHVERILHHNPFEVIDKDGVGELMRLAIQRGKAARPELKLGLCGEHGGDPTSIALCEKLGLTYVSCSPYRIEIARLAAAHAALGAERTDV